MTLPYPLHENDEHTPGSYSPHQTKQIQTQESNGILHSQIQRKMHHFNPIRPSQTDET